jgi:hydrogenase maturation protease
MLKNILIYGYGNPGRQDDGLGNAFVDKFEEWVKIKGWEGFTFDSNYQLNIEDAEAIRDKDLVIFVDASTEDIEDFILTPVSESSKVAFTTHAATPGYIVKLCTDLFSKNPAAYLLHIKGYQWDFKEGIGEKAMANLELAMNAMKEKLADPDQLIQSFNTINYSEN